MSQQPNGNDTTYIQSVVSSTTRDANTLIRYALQAISWWIEGTSLNVTDVIPHVRRAVEATLDEYRATIDSWIAESREDWEHDVTVWLSALSGDIADLRAYMGHSIVQVQTQLRDVLRDANYVTWDWMNAYLASVAVTPEVVKEMIEAELAKTTHETNSIIDSLFSWLGGTFEDVIVWGFQQMWNGLAEAL